MELRDALRRIREECDSHEECFYCPLRGAMDDSCDITNKIPENWEFSDEVRPLRVLN